MRELERGKIDPEFTPTSHDPVPKPGGAGQGIGRGRGGRLSALTAVGASGDGGRGRDPIEPHRESEYFNADSLARVFATVWTKGFGHPLRELFEVDSEAAKQSIASILDSFLEPSFLSEHAKEFVTRTGVQAFEEGIMPSEIVNLLDFGIEESILNKPVGLRLETPRVRRHVYFEGQDLIAFEIFLSSDYMRFKEQNLHGFTQNSEEDTFQYNWQITISNIFHKYTNEQ